MLVRAINTHPQWKSKDNIADISLVFLTEEVELNSAIQVVKLPFGNPIVKENLLEKKEFEKMVEKEDLDQTTVTGTLVGWRKKNRKSQKILDSAPNTIAIPIVNASYCVSAFPDLKNYIRNNTFCGGYEDKSFSPCLGDTSSGLYFRKSSSEKWKILGIISVSPLDKLGCDINTFSVYTNITSYSNWIQKQMNSLNWDNIDFSCSRR